MAYLYILESLKNKRYYIGSTNDLHRRLKEHHSGKSRYTQKLLPVKLVFRQKFQDSKTARKVEFWLKRQKDADFIQRIVKDGKIQKIF